MLAAIPPTGMVARVVLGQHVDGFLKCSVARLMLQIRRSVIHVFDEIGARFRG